MPAFPEYRPRRLRRTESLRRLIQETRLAPSQLVLPMFVRSGSKIRNPVGSMPGVFQLSVDEMLRELDEASEEGVGGVILFGLPDSKDATGSSAWDEKGPVPNAVRMFSVTRTSAGPGQSVHDGSSLAIHELVPDANTPAPLGAV